MDNITEMLKGVLEGSVLEIISRKKTYGYAITVVPPRPQVYRRG